MKILKSKPTQKGYRMKKVSLFLIVISLLCVIFTAVSCGDATTTTAQTTETQAPTVSTPVATSSAKVSTTAPAVTTTVLTTTTVTTATTVAATTTATAKKPDPKMTAVSKLIDPNTAFKKESFAASNGLTLPYRIFVPEDYSEEYAYPVVLLLHGAGERGTDNEAQLKHVVSNLYVKKTSPFYHAIVIVPQCPANMQWVDTPWANGNYSIENVPISKPMTAVVELLDSVIETYSVNTDRQYVTGLSMGGFGTWDLIMRYPDRFAAAIPYCGGADPSQAENLAKIPIWTFHDTQDTSVPVSGTQEVVAAIKAAGGTLITYKETTGLGHNVWSSGSQTPSLSTWLFEQRKDK